jgi:hypothetical protein
VISGLLLVVLLAATPSAAQDLPDPGRRVDRPEPKKTRKRDEPACKSARMNRHMSCGKKDSPRSRSTECTEAIVIQKQNCS